MFTFPEQYIFYLNIAIFVFYLLMFYWGYKKGFLYQVLITFGTVFSFFAAWRYAPVFASHYMLVPERFIPKELLLMKDMIQVYLNELLWYLLLFIAMKGFFFIITKIIGGLRKMPVVKQISGLLGGILGVISATVWILVICVFLNTSIIKNGKTIIEKTWLSNIRDFTTTAVSSFGIPEKSSEAFHTLVNDMENLSGQDKKILDQWLEEHGFENLENIQQ